jgi:aarF domain-containing kinase
MPDSQTESVLQRSLGASTYPACFSSFTTMPFAAASIGQVHAAVLAADASPTGKEEKVAVKVQFPNVRDSITGDLGYVKMLLTMGAVLPRGLFLDRTVEVRRSFPSRCECCTDPLTRLRCSQVMKQELADECDYAREASFLRRFRAPEWLGADPRFKVPWVWEGSTPDVLVMERLNGTSVGKLAAQLSQADRDEVRSRCS